MKSYWTSRKEESIRWSAFVNLCLCSCKSDKEKKYILKNFRRKKNELKIQPNMWLHFVGYLHGLIVLLFIAQSNASDATFFPSPSTPLSNVDALAQLPLTEDNFTSVFPIVCIDDGCIEGRATPGFQIDEYESFFGIPYAEPPVGKLRFAVRKQSKANFYVSLSI